MSSNNKTLYYLILPEVSINRQEFVMDGKDQKVHCEKTLQCMLLEFSL